MAFGTLELTDAQIVDGGVVAGTLSASLTSRLALQAKNVVYELSMTINTNSELSPTRFLQSLSRIRGVTALYISGVTIYRNEKTTILAHDKKLQRMRATADNFQQNLTFHDII